MMTVHCRLPLKLIVSMLLLAGSPLQAGEEGDSLALRVEGVITFDNGSIARFKAVGGAPLIVRDERDGISHSFFSLQDPATGELGLKTVEARTFGRPSWKSIPLENSTSQPETKCASFRGSSFRLDLVLGASPLSTQVGNAETEQRQRLLNKAGGICCVTCGSRTICASSVSMSCGSCDSAGDYDINLP